MSDSLYVVTAGSPPLIDANGDGIGKYSIYQLNDQGRYTKVGKWIAGKEFYLDVERVRYVMFTLAKDCLLFLILWNHPPLMPPSNHRKAEQQGALTRTGLFFMFWIFKIIYVTSRRVFLFNLRSWKILGSGRFTDQNLFACTINAFRQSVRTDHLMISWLYTSVIV